MPPESATLRRPFVLAGCIAAMFMAAVEATIVATAMPTIIAKLGGFALLGWVFAVYLLTQAVTVPIYGRLSDLYGRKRVFNFGAVLFLVGSVLCGFAPTMLALVIFRAVQGLGAGAIMSIAQTIVGDIYTPRERAQVQGYLSSVWGASAIVGPLLGAFIVQHLTWSLVFWLNVPIGIAAMVLLALFLPERPPQGTQSPDVLGTVLLAASSGGLILALLEAEELGWWTVPLLGVVAACFVLLLWQERRAPAPMLPLGLWRNRMVIAGNSGGLAIGAVMMGVSAFLPTYVQGVMGSGPLVAGTMLALMSIGWPITSTLAGRMMVTTSYRTTALIGGVLLVAGSLILLSLGQGSGPMQAGLGSFVIGAGMGMANTTFLVSVQNAVGPELRGIATASTVFMRMLGSSLGTALLGAVLNLGLARRLNGVVDPVQTLMDPARRAALGAEVGRLAGAVGGAMHGVFWTTVVLAILALGVAWLTPARARPAMERRA